MGRPRPKVAISWIEVILVAILVISAMGIWSFVEQQINQQLKSQERSLESFQQAAQLPDLKRRLSLDQDELVITRKKLAEQQIELAQQNSKLQAAEATYPKLSQAILRAASLPPDVIKNYQSNKLEQKAVNRLVKKLRSKSSALDNRITNATQSMFEAQESSSEKFEAEKVRHEWTRRLSTLGWSSGFVIGTMTVLAYVTSLFSKHKSLEIKVRLVFSGAIALQSILFGYQAFGVMGAALASTLLFFILLSVLSYKTS